MYHIRLGNTSPHNARRHPDTDALILEPFEGPQVTTVNCSASSVIDALKEVTDLWRFHSSAPPSWVSADNEALELVLSENFGCPRGEPDDAPLTVPTAATQEG